MYQVSKQSSKKTEFTVDLIWWGSLRFATGIAIKELATNLLEADVEILLYKCAHCIGNNFSSYRKL